MTSFQCYDYVLFKSGTAFANWAFDNNPEQERQDAFDLGLELGCPGTDSASLVACLRTKDPEALRVAADKVLVV